MNFIDTMASVELVLAANQVPLLVGETGIGKTSLAARVADVHDWELVTIYGNGGNGDAHRWLWPYS